MIVEFFQTIVTNGMDIAIIIVIKLMGYVGFLQLELHHTICRGGVSPPARPKMQLLFLSDTHRKIWVRIYIMLLQLQRTAHTQTF